MAISLFGQAYKGEIWNNWQNVGKMMGLSARDIYATYVSASAIPVLGEFLKASDSIARMDDYMGNRGLSYGDVRYPTHTVGAGFGSATSGLLSLSANVKHLY